MLTQAVYISLIGIGVVFTFLCIIFLLLRGLSCFAVKEKEVSNIKKQDVNQNLANRGNGEQEIIAAIIAAINEHEEIGRGSHIVISKK